jgi:hypothetical protein
LPAIANWRERGRMRAKEVRRGRMDIRVGRIMYT